MKKLRSKLPRRKRSNFSPILKPSVVVKLDSSSINDSSSILTHEVAISCDSTSRVSTNNKAVKKRGYGNRIGAGSSAGEFLRITRSYSKRMELMVEKEFEVSEASSCVELLNSSSKRLIRKGSEVLKSAKCENDDAVSVSVFGIENSDVTTRSECSIVPKRLKNGRDIDNLQGIDETDVVSVSSRLLSPQAKFGTVSQLNEGQSAYATTISSPSRLESACTKVSGTTVNEGQPVNEGQTVNDETENYGESKLISVDFDLTCSENLSCDYEECDQSSTECTDVNMESSEIEFSSDFVTSSWYDSSSQFSERSFGDTTSSPTFQLFLIYRKKFCKSEFSTVFSSNEPYISITKLLRPEDEEHEESYQMMKERERRQVYLYDYSEEYREMKEYGDLVIQQRYQMVQWMIEESANKELQKETTFLGVGLLDRFFSKGYFRNKRELEIVGIACLTLATRIEENQTFNSIRQKFFHLGSNEYSRSEVVAMEWLVQEVLNFKCFLPTIYNFLWFYLKAVRADEDMEKTANYIAILALMGHEQLCYWPSTVAASLVILACLGDNEQSTHQQIAWIYDGSNDKDLPNCLKSLEWMVKYIC